MQWYMLPSVEDVLLSLSYSLFTGLKINEKKGGNGRMKKRAKWRDLDRKCGLSELSRE